MALIIKIIIANKVICFISSNLILARWYKYIECMYFERGRIVNGHVHLEFLLARIIINRTIHISAIRFFTLSPIVRRIASLRFNFIRNYSGIGLRICLHGLCDRVQVIIGDGLPCRAGYGVMVLGDAHCVQHGVLGH